MNFTYFIPLGPDELEIYPVFHGITGWALNTAQVVTFYVSFLSCGMFAYQYPVHPPVVKCSWPLAGKSLQIAVL